MLYWKNFRAWTAKCYHCHCSR